MRTLVPGYPAVIERARRRRADLRIAPFLRRTGAAAERPRRRARSLRPGCAAFLCPPGQSLYRAGRRATGRTTRCASPPWRASAPASAPAIAARTIAPAVVQAHDWQAGLLPAYLHYERRGGGPADGHDRSQPGISGPVLRRLVAVPRPAASLPSRSMASSITAASASSRPGCNSPIGSPRSRRPTPLEICTTDERGMGLGGLLAQPGPACCAASSTASTRASGIRRAIPFSPRPSMPSDRRSPRENKAELQRPFRAVRRTATDRCSGSSAGSPGRRGSICCWVRCRSCWGKVPSSPCWAPASRGSRAGFAPPLPIEPGPHRLPHRL